MTDKANMEHVRNHILMVQVTETRPNWPSNASCNFIVFFFSKMGNIKYDTVWNFNQNSASLKNGIHNKRVSLYCIFFT